LALELYSLRLEQPQQLQEVATSFNQEAVAGLGALRAAPHLLWLETEAKGSPARVVAAAGQGCA